MGVQKIWIALSVCGTTHAVHLEVVDSLATDEFLLAFRRFVARWSMPFQFRSDNATIFAPLQSFCQCVGFLIHHVVHGGEDSTRGW